MTTKKKFKTTFRLVKPTMSVVKIPERGILGYAYQDDSHIEIDFRQNQKEFLNTIIHECLHCYLPYLHEKYIIKMADSISELIWRKNYRKKIKNNNAGTASKSKRKQAK